MTDRREASARSPGAASGAKPPGPAADRERVLLLECRLEQMRAGLEAARMEADRARLKLAEASAREAEHARRFSLIHEELAEARGEIAALHRHLERSEALRAEIAGHLFEGGARDDAEELVRLRQKVLADDQRALVSDRTVARLRARVEELVSSRETLLTRIAEWQQLIREDGPEAADLSEFLAELRRDILELEHRSVTSDAREAMLRDRLARAGIDPDREGDEPAVDEPLDDETADATEALDAPASAESGGVEALIESDAGASEAPAGRASEARVREAPSTDAPTRGAAVGEAPARRAVPEGLVDTAAPTSRVDSAEGPASAVTPDVVERAPAPSMPDAEGAPLAADPARSAELAAAEEVSDHTVPEPAGEAPHAAEVAPHADVPPSDLPVHDLDASTELDAEATPAPEPVRLDSRTEALIEELEHADSPALQAALLLRLGRSGDEGAAPILRPWTGSADPSVRAAAYEAFGRLLERDPDSLEPHLREGLADPDARVRRRVVLAAATARGLSTRDLLDPLREDPDAQVRRVVREVLRQASARRPRTLGPDPVRNVEASPAAALDRAVSSPDVPESVGHAPAQRRSGGT